MARTVSTSPPALGRPDDLDGAIVDGAEALRQRITRAIRFRLRTWFLARSRGLDYNLVIGHRISPALAASAISDVIRGEGGVEVLGVTDVTWNLDRPGRVFRYSARVDTIYGPMAVTEDV